MSTIDKNMLSVIVPFYNEAENLPILIRQLINVLKNLPDRYEIILVDDGSTDLPAANLSLKNSNLRLIRHDRRLGKGEALNTGIKNSRGDILIFMDADLQDNPLDIPKFIKKINEGFDFVNGVRFSRKDSFLIKLYSKVANWFLKTFLGSPFSDVNCGFKAFKRKVLQQVFLYGNNFRFFPLAVYYRGFRVSEILVDNQPRRFGKSKYGKGKILVGIIDILTAYFLFAFSEKPLHFFGAIGGILFFLGFLLSLFLTIERFFFGMLLYRRPALFLGILLIIVGIQIIMTGILGELIVYLQQKNKYNS